MLLYVAACSCTLDYIAVLKYVTVYYSVTVGLLLHELRYCVILYVAVC
jgi:hypothetical protein